MQSAPNTVRYISRSRHLTQGGIFHAVGTSRTDSTCQAFFKFRKPRDPLCFDKRQISWIFFFVADKFRFCPVGNLTTVYQLLHMKRLF